MCSAGAAAGAQGAAGITQAYGQYQQGKMNESYYNYLGDQTKKQAELVDEATGEQLASINFDASRQNKQVVENSNQTISSQKAAMAANGVYSDSGTFSDIINDSVDKQAMDEAMVKYNADQSSWQVKRSDINQKLELKTREIDYRTQGKNARVAGNMNAFGTLVGTAAQSGATYASMGGKGFSKSDSGGGYRENYSGIGSRRPGS